MVHLTVLAPASAVLALEVFPVLWTISTRPVVLGLVPVEVKRSTVLIEDSRRYQATWVLFFPPKNCDASAPRQGLRNLHEEFNKLAALDNACVTTFVQNTTVVAYHPQSVGFDIFVLKASVRVRDRRVF